MEFNEKLQELRRNRGLTQEELAGKLFVSRTVRYKSLGILKEVSLLSLTEIAPYLRAAYFVVVIAIILFGILTLALQNCGEAFWVKNKSKISLLLNIIGALLFIISSQPYATVLLFVFLVIKVLMLIKR